MTVLPLGFNDFMFSGCDGACGVSGVDGQFCILYNPFVIIG
jgi:hypothetical protein